MKVRMVMLSVEVQTLSVDSLSAMLHQVADSINREITSGTLNMDDGDTVTWAVKYGDLVPVHTSL